MSPLYLTRNVSPIPPIIEVVHVRPEAATQGVGAVAEGVQWFNEWSVPVSQPKDFGVEQSA
jgi:hypothetical protein